MTQRALIVIDVQNEYVSGELPIEFPEVDVSLGQIARAMDEARTARIPVIVVQHSAPAGSPLFARGGDGWGLHEVVSARPRDHLVEKKLPDAFVGTGLADWLDDHGIDTLSVVGYMTQNCVDSTIRHAFHRGMAVEFLSDAAGTASFANSAGFANAEEIHRAFCVAMQARFAAVMSTAQWIELLRTGDAPPRDNLYSSHQRARAAGVGEAAS
jgi:nicotinamidase-related amidase